MSEYRRFIAYFYEYIDGKKQGNAGFAKIELRNGLWRFFLRLTAGACPVPPIQVYGFVREEDHLLGLPLGTIRPVQQIAEEWAFQDDVTIGEGKRRLEELSGIWIESGDGRQFITSWDEEEIDAGRLVTEAEAAEREAEEDKSVPDEKEEAESVLPEPKEVPVIEAAETEPEGDKSEPDEKEEVENGAGLEDMLSVEAVRADSDIVGQLPDEKEEDEAEENKAEENEIKEDIEENTTERSTTEENAVPRTLEPGRAVLEELFRKRASFQPFPDGAIESCVMILPCDIARLQQENWQVGRSSFLQHGFYQYRHLLLGRAGDGTYVLGVPGIDNPQEEYMAQMFGYEQFRRSARRDSDRNFGYWCRELRQI